MFEFGCLGAIALLTGFLIKLVRAEITDRARDRAYKKRWMTWAEMTDLRKGA